MPHSRRLLLEEGETVLTDGYDLYLRVRRGVYHRVTRRGQRMGITCSQFVPRVRWKPAKRCRPCYEAKGRPTYECISCGEAMAEPTDAMRCGFCLAEVDAA